MQKCRNAECRNANGSSSVQAFVHSCIRAFLHLVHLDRPSPRAHGVDEARNHPIDAIRRLDELEPGPVDYALLLDIADAAVDDASLDDDRLVAECEPQFVK